MSEPTKYVICSNNCTFEAYDKEEMLAVLQQAIDNQSLSGIDSDAGFVTKIKEQNSNAAIKFWIGTQAQFNAIPTKEANCTYIFQDDSTLDDINSAIDNIINGATPVAAATNAVNATNATNAVNATKTSFSNTPFTSYDFDNQPSLVENATYQFLFKIGSSNYQCIFTAYHNAIIMSNESLTMMIMQVVGGGLQIIGTYNDANVVDAGITNCKIRRLS